MRGARSTARSLWLSDVVLSYQCKSHRIIQASELKYNIWHKRGRSPIFVLIVTARQPKKWLWRVLAFEWGLENSFQRDHPIPLGLSPFGRPDESLPGTYAEPVSPVRVLAQMRNYYQISYVFDQNWRFFFKSAIFSSCCTGTNPILRKTLIPPSVELEIYAVIWRNTNWGPQIYWASLNRKRRTPNPSLAATIMLTK